MADACFFEISSDWVPGVFRVTDYMIVHILQEISQDLSTCLKKYQTLCTDICNVMLKQCHNMLQVISRCEIFCDKSCDKASAISVIYWGTSRQTINCRIRMI